ncbi:MAG: pirin family protein [Rhodocyclaceae bacterium]
MISIRPSGSRGHANHGWLDTHHSFSFAGYHDPAHMGWSVLRVINEDRIAPGKGFGMHGHRDMEIVTCVLEGELEHRDSMGNGAVIRPGEFQRMSAGTGVMHSEFNPSPDEATHLLQIWILPEAQGMEPGYEQKAFAASELRGRLLPVASREGCGGGLTLHQDVVLYAARLAPGERVEQALAPGRCAYAQIARGAIELNGIPLAAGDGAKLRDETQLRILARSEAELLLFDLPAQV